VDRRSPADSKGQAALDRALEAQNLLLVYQPIHHAHTGAIVAAEALLRQFRQTGEVREAGIITEAAEQGPDLFTLDSWTMRTAYADAAHWQERFDVRLNVNLSAREFQEGNVLPRLTELISGCGIDTRKINLEITETSYIEDPEKTMYILRELKKLGIALWLDDFGTGHSSIEHLLRFPLDGLKIPRTFVRGIPEDHRSRSITHALIALAHDLEVRVIAEGIEKAEQLQFLRDEGCDAIQGFLFSKPMTREELERVLESASC
jgi:EAL domain-containing protein (putative c-di-GMP-specific phosphodiesterase class I)